MPNGPQQEIAQIFGRQWALRRPYVYRYLPSEHVDQFFKDGSIRISSFNCFAGHDDEHRADPEEGFCHVAHINAEGTGQTVLAAMSFGQRAYVVCGSTHYSKILSEKFECDSGIRINDPTKFAEAISYRLSGFVGGMEGPCHYLPERSVLRDLGPQDLSRFRDENSGDPTPEFEQFMHQLAGNDPLFIKHTSYASQSEYRLLWFVHDEVDSFIDIKCPEATQFCTHFRDLRAELHTGEGRVAQ